MSSKIVLFAAIAALAVSALAVDSAVAAKGGNGGKGGGKPAPAPTATLTISPNPVPAWGYIYTVTGTGFKPNSAVNFVRGGLVTFVLSDANGFAATTYQSWDPGTYRIDAYQHNGKSWVVVGSVTFQVV